MIDSPISDAADDFAHAGSVVQLGVPPVRIDILTKISAVTFREAWRTRVFGRPKDLLDLALLDERPARPRAKPRRKRKRSASTSR